MEKPNFRFALREDLKDKKEFLPTRAEPMATGWDVRAAMEDGKDLVLKPFDSVKIKLGFRSMCPAGWWYKAVPRSSTFGKKNLHCLYGVVDESWNGETMLACQWIPSFPNKPEILGNSFKELFNFYIKPDIFKEYMAQSLTIKFGEAIAQLIPVKRVEMEVSEVDNETIEKLFKEQGGIRGAGGFGSSDKGFKV